MAFAGRPSAGGGLISKHAVCFGGEFLTGLAGLSSFKSGEAVSTKAADTNSRGLLQQIPG